MFLLGTVLDAYQLGMVPEALSFANRSSALPDTAEPLRDKLVEVPLDTAVFQPDRPGGGEPAAGLRPDRPEVRLDKLTAPDIAEAQADTVEVPVDTAVGAPGTVEALADIAGGSPGTVEAPADTAEALPAHRSLSRLSGRLLREIVDGRRWGLGCPNRGRAHWAIALSARRVQGICLLSLLLIRGLVSRPVGVELVAGIARPPGPKITESRVVDGISAGRARKEIIQKTVARYG